MTRRPETLDELRVGDEVAILPSGRFDAVPEIGVVQKVTKTQVTGRDRIAVLVSPCGVVGISGQDGLINENYWRDLEDDAMTYFGAEPLECVRAIIRCNLPRPPEPVEVEGSVEVVG